MALSSDAGSAGESSALPWWAHVALLQTDIQFTEVPPPAKLELVGSSGGDGNPVRMPSTNVPPFTVPMG
jgi:hypothetical protein